MTNENEKKLYENVKQKDSIFHIWWNANKTRVKNLILFLLTATIAIVASIIQYQHGAPFFLNKLYYANKGIMSVGSDRVIDTFFVLFFEFMIIITFYAFVSCIVIDEITKLVQYITFVKRQSYLPMTKEELDALGLRTVKEYADFIFDLRHVGENDFYSHKFNLFDVEDVCDFARAFYQVKPGSEDDAYLFAYIMFDGKYDIEYAKKYIEDYDNVVMD